MIIWYLSFKYENWSKNWFYYEFKGRFIKYIRIGACGEKEIGLRHGDKNRSTNQIRDDL